MKKLIFRAVSVLVLILAIAAGTALFLVRYAREGETWAGFRSNGNVYKNGVLTRGELVSGDGVTLASFSESGLSYAEDYKTRVSTLHLVGDRAGNTAYGAISLFRSRLMGYSLSGGVYAEDGAGETVTLSVSAKVSNAAYDALSGRSGAVMVADYETGEILCMVSTPSFDPADPPTISADDTSGVYVNRAISAAYPPGSVFKLVTLAAAIENIDDLYDRAFHCEGSRTFGTGTVVCTRAHGDMKIEDALAMSCNCVFAELAVELGADTMAEYADKLGLTESFSIDGAKVTAGSYDKSGDSIYLAWSGAGQYHDLVTPAGMMRLAAAVANGGAACDFTLLEKPAGEAAQSRRVLSDDTAKKMRDMMRYAVTLTYGEENFPGLQLCAKSGTAEVGGGQAPHAWFVGFIENEEHPYAFAVVVENGGWGAGTAGSVANTVLQAAVSG